MQDHSSSFQPPAAKPVSPHAGHRERLRERARDSAFKGVADYELVELFLFRSIPQRDVKPLAKALLARFGSLGALLAASEEELRTISAIDNKGRTLKVGPEVALDIMAMRELGLRISQEPIKGRTVISSWSALLAYVREAMAHQSREQFRVLFLDTKNQLILDEVMNHGTGDQAPVYPPEIMRRALELSAKAVILVHNHPSGDPQPSRADIDMTRQVVEAGKPLQIAVHDHLIVGREGVESLKARGLF